MLALGNTSKAVSSSDIGPGAPDDSIHSRASSGGRPARSHSSATIAVIDGTRNAQVECRAYSSSATTGSKSIIRRLRPPDARWARLKPP